MPTKPPDVLLAECDAALTLLEQTEAELTDGEWEPRPVQAPRPIHEPDCGIVAPDHQGVIGEFFAEAKQRGKFDPATCLQYGLPKCCGQTTTLDILNEPCPVCGGIVYGYDMRGKGCYFIWCRSCKQCWADCDLTQPIPCPHVADSTTAAKEQK